MLQFIPSLPTYAEDKTAQRVWQWVKERFNNEEGTCYYKHPIVGAATGIVPDLTLLVRTNQPLAIRCLPYQLEEIETVDQDIWKVKNTEMESPLLELEDFVVGLQGRFDKERMLRRRLKPQAVLALPLISQHDFEERFNTALDNAYVIWANGDTDVLLFPFERELSNEEWQLTRSVIQTATPLSKSPSHMPMTVNSLGSAIRVLDQQIALLDVEQEKVAIQIPPGPQCIRGLAGTGKTVLLAMKAANIHRHFPDKRILFTFNTQSLYNQAKTLISKFYRVHSDVDPDWERLHIRHGWGGRNQAGVYSDLCARQNVPYLDFREARSIRPNNPFQACCERALGLPILPEYDFILMDEAQDFPREFFRILFKLAFPPHQIYWAYDELQSLSSLEIPKPEDLFGSDQNGNPLVSLEGDNYPGGIEKDFVLHRSYRCPQSVLMLAHAIGLGLYSPNGSIQMLGDKESWESIGYEVENGTLQKGKEVIISRPSSNSPNRISNIYIGQELITAKIFEDRDVELDWIADSIRKDVKDENVAPEQIVVISLDAIKAKGYLERLQKRLVDRGIASTIPGLIHGAASFAEAGRVTLCTVFRAKGNEAYIVYILGFDALYDYIEEIGNRNKAFTSITRSKAWVRITGTGKNMEKAKGEIDQILSDSPQFKFIFPDIDKIRRLDAETSRRREEARKAKKTFTEIMHLDPKALTAALDPSDFEMLLRHITEAQSEN